MNRYTKTLIAALLLLTLAGLANGAGNRLLVQVNGYMHKAPELKSDTAAAVAVNDTLIFGAEKGGWYRVVDTAGAERGWITSDLVKVLETALIPPLTGNIVMQADGPMVRTITSGAEVSGYFEKGHRLQYTGQQDGWFRILNADGTEAGFISPMLASVDTTTPEPEMIAISREDTITLGQIADSVEPGDSAGMKAAWADSTGKIPDGKRYVYFRTGRLKITANGPVFDIPSTAGKFNRGVAYAEIHHFSEKQEGYFKMIGDRGDTLGWVYSSIVRVLQEPETLVFYATDSLAALRIMDSLAVSYVRDPSEIAELDTAGQVTFVQPESKFAMLKNKALLYAKDHKGIVAAGGGVVAGAILLAVLLSGDDSGGSDNGGVITPPGGGTGGGDGDIPDIDVRPPSR